MIISKISKTALQEFLGEADTRLGLMAELEPFFQNAEQGIYPFSAASDELKREALKVLRGLFGDKVKKVVFYSQNHPFPKPEWMTQGVYKTALRGNLGVSLINKLGDSFGYNLGDKFGYCRSNSLWDNLWDNLITNLRDILGDNLGYILWTCLFYLLALAIMDKNKELEHLRPLIRLLPKAIPLGEKMDEDGTWIVLCA